MSMMDESLLILNQYILNMNAAKIALLGLVSTAWGNFEIYYEDEEEMEADPDLCYEHQSPIDIVDNEHDGEVI